MNDPATPQEAEEVSLAVPLHHERIYEHGAAPYLMIWVDGDWRGASVRSRGTDPAGRIILSTEIRLPSPCGRYLDGYARRYVWAPDRMRVTYSSRPYRWHPGIS